MASSFLTIGAAVAAAGGAGVCVLGHGLFAARSQLFGPLVYRGSASGRQLTLTFDDGPSVEATEQILDVLDRFGICATFFVIGRYVQAHRRIVERIAQSGHLIGNHTYDHHRTGLFGRQAYWLDQIGRTQEVIGEITGCAPVYFRPPMGFKNPHVMAAAGAFGCRVVTWSWRARDGVNSTPSAIVARAGRCHSGDILMLHDGRDPRSNRSLRPTMEALPELIESLLARGFSFVRLDALIEPINQTSPESCGVE